MPQTTTPQTVFQNQQTNSYSSNNSVPPTQNTSPESGSNRKIFLIIIFLVICLIGLGISFKIGMTGKNIDSKDLTAQISVIPSEFDKPLTPTLPVSTPYVTKTQIGKELSNNSSASDNDKNIALNALEYIKKSLQCQYAIDGKYPATLTQIDQRCFPTSNFEVPNILINYMDPLSYRSTNGSQGFSFEMPVVVGEGYLVTEKSTEYVIIPKNIQNELMAKSRDEIVKVHLNVFRKLIESVSIGNNSKDNILCNGLPYPCYGNSLLSTASNTDGTGWIKINFNQQNIHLDKLPTNTVNNANYHYIYCADQSGWEIVTVFESTANAEDMQNDGGFDDTKYEIGTNLKLMNHTPNCKY